MYRSTGPPSKASASTRCQKCLQYGHYSYECKVSMKNRPYISRPSRTQQLFDPLLQPKLSEDTPNPLLQKAGIADAQLAKAEAERARQRSTSISSSSSTDSVETISTNASRSQSPPPKRRRMSAERPVNDRDGRQYQRKQRRDGKEHTEENQDVCLHEDGHGRKRYSSLSRSRSPEREDGKRKDRSRGWRASLPKTSVNAGLRSPSPNSYEQHAPRRKRSRPRSPYRKNRRPVSRSPPRRYSQHAQDSNRKDAHQDRGHERYRKGRYGRDISDRPVRGRYEHEDGGTVTYGKAPRERSLSPYSKRIALTRALNQGE